MYTVSKKMKSHKISIGVNKFYLIPSDVHCFQPKIMKQFLIACKIVNVDNNSPGAHAFL
jgi:hypothetical protein